MAERRMLHRKASVSADLADLRRRHGGDAVAFFLLLIPHLDRYGACPNDPIRLRALVVPLWTDLAVDDVAAWLRWLIRRGILERCRDANGGKGLRAVRFHEHQSGAHIGRESPSKYEPEDWNPDEVRTRSGEERNQRKGSKRGRAAAEGPPARVDLDKIGEDSEVVREARRRGRSGQ